MICRNRNCTKPANRDRTFAPLGNFYGYCSIQHKKEQEEHDEEQKRLPHLAMPAPETISIWNDEEDLKQKNRDMLTDLVDDIVSFPSSDSSSDNFSGDGGSFDGGGSSGSWND